MAKLDPEILAHLEWIGFVRPTGLVVSAPALVRAGAILDRRDVEGQRLLRGCVEERTIDPKEGPVAYLPGRKRRSPSSSPAIARIGNPPRTPARSAVSSHEHPRSVRPEHPR